MWTKHATFMLSIIHAPMVSGELEKNIATFVECVSHANFPSLLVSYQVKGMCETSWVQEQLEN